VLLFSFLVLADGFSVYPFWFTYKMLFIWLTGSLIFLPLESYENYYCPYPNDWEFLIEICLLGFSDVYGLGETDLEPPTLGDIDVDF